MNNLLFIMIYNLFKYSTSMSLMIINFTSLLFYDILIIWFIMEISNFLFICLMNMSLKNKKSIFLYFMIQAISSMMIIYLISSNVLFHNNFSNTLMILSLMMKISIPPFHFWLIIISKFLSWEILLILLTLQKITPFYIMSIMNINNLITYTIVILCSVIPPYMMLNLKNFKMMFSYSSINQSSWMIMLINTKSLIWMKYFIFYIFIMTSLFIFMKYFKIFYNYNYTHSHNMKFNILLIMFMINLAGMPPMTLFYIKWLSMYLFLKNSFTMIMLIIMMISSLIMLYIYTNMMINYMFIYKFNSKLYNIYLPKNQLLMMFFYMSLTLSSLMFII